MTLTDTIGTEANRITRKETSQKMNHGFSEGVWKGKRSSKVSYLSMMADVPVENPKVYPIAWCMSWYATTEEELPLVRSTFSSALVKAGASFVGLSWEPLSGRAEKNKPL